MGFNLKSMNRNLSDKSEINHFLYGISRFSLSLSKVIDAKFVNPLMFFKYEVLLALCHSAEQIFIVFR